MGVGAMNAKHHVIRTEDGDVAILVIVIVLSKYNQSLMVLVATDIIVIGDAAGAETADRTTDQENYVKAFALGVAAGVTSGATAQKETSDGDRQAATDTTGTETETTTDATRGADLLGLPTVETSSVGEITQIHQGKKTQDRRVPADTIGMLAAARLQTEILG